RYVQITDEQWIEAVKERLDPHALDHLSHLWRYFRSSGIGKDGFPSADLIRSVTGNDPLSIEQFFKDNAEAFGGI
ncbi:MAG: hypothetical protein ACREDR_26950, partial [Blastocatellia bacterium]